MYVNPSSTACLGSVGVALKIPLGVIAKYSVKKVYDGILVIRRID
jgi:hypothetical protein